MASLVVALAAMAVGPSAPAAAADEGAVSIDSHHTDDQLPVGIVRVSGSYHGLYDLNIVVNGERMDRVRMTDPENDDSGNWSYDLDTRPYDGDLEIAVLGISDVTRYGVWSSWVLMHVDNPAANKPTVTVTSPAEGSSVTEPTTVTVSATGRNDIRRVEIRVNGNAWQPAELVGGEYRYPLDPRPFGDTMASIEARATDSRGNVGTSHPQYVSLNGGAPAPVVPHAQDRAMWMWEESSYNLVNNPGARSVLEALTTDTATFNSRPIKTIYFGVDRGWDNNMLEDMRPQVRDLLRWAHDRGYKVHALIAGGTRPPFLGGLWRYRDHAVREMEKVLNFNLSSAPAERFDGVNVDIEPYIIGPSYIDDRPFVQLQWLDTLQTLIDRRDASGTGILFGPAMPVWLDSETVTWHGVTKTMAQHFQDISDYVSLMDYRDTAEAIVRDAATEVAYAQQIGKPGSVLVGVETIDLVAVGGDPEWVTFSEEGRAGLETEVAKVYDQFAGSPGFGGVAMHHYDSLLDLPSTWAPGGLLPPMPVDAQAPTAVSSAPIASTVDFSRVDLRYGRAHDNGEVHHYNVYRSESHDVAVVPGNLVGRTHGLGYTDTGLLANKRYYYRVTAVDMKGNEGPPSAVTSARTERSNLRPMVVREAATTLADGTIRITAQVVDARTGAGVPAKVEGRFTKSASQYLWMSADASGRVSGVSAPQTAASGTAGFAIHRIVAPGYYWASSEDLAQAGEVVW
ncbi:Ig-like domain-containing protein [Micromonospora sp. NPDC007230]|uniref:Ig-like domain-containing protein n=1 Tax=Micromonospora sp. NPDC007230 TaxID=3364237 RepID=UPI0036A14960